MSNDTVNSFIHPCIGVIRITTTRQIHRARFKKWNILTSVSKPNKNQI